MFNFFNPNFSAPQPDPSNPYAEMMKLWTTGLPNAPSAPAIPVLSNFNPNPQFVEQLAAFYDAFQKQGTNPIGTESFDNMMKKFNFNPLAPQAAASPFVWPAPISQPPFLSGTPANQTAESLPALGIARQWHEDFAALIKLQQEDAECRNRFMNLFSNFSVNVGQRVSAELSGLQLEKLTFDKLCRIWIDCCEDEYQLVASSKNYSSAYAAMLNASMRLRRHAEKIADQTARLQNQPTRSELDSLHESLAKAKDREARLLERISDLEQKVAALMPAVRPKRASKANEAQKPKRSERSS